MPVLRLAAGGALVLAAAASAGDGAPATVRFSFDARAGTFVLSGGGTLSLSDVPSGGSFERARAVRATVTIRRGDSRASFVPTRAGYVALQTIGVLVQEVRLSDRITRSSLGGCRVGSAGSLVVEAERNQPAARSFADDGVIFELCGSRGADPAASTQIVLSGR